MSDEIKKQEDEVRSLHAEWGACGARLRTLVRELYEAEREDAKAKEEWIKESRKLWDMRKEEAK